MGVSKRSSVLVAFALALSAAPVFAQTGTITGRLTASDTGLPLVSAFVEVISQDGRTAISTASNQNGVYRVTGLPAGTYRITVSAIGYGTQELSTVQLSAGGTVTADGSLEPRAIELNPVVVSVSKKQEKALDAPARVEVVSEREIDVRPSTTPVDHLRSTPAVDVITSGLQSTNVVVRGFNNIFSGALHTLTDNRIAGIPSLRVNLMHFIPQTDADFERMEVVLGPGSALYGPNTANGVLHIITKSPIDNPGTMFSVAGGERSVFQFSGRTAHRLSDQFGIKVSGQYFQGNEWEYLDPTEGLEKAKATGNFAAWAATQPLDTDGTPLTTAELQRRASRLAARDFDIERYSVDARADWRPTEDFTAMFSAGRTMAANGIELTGIGAGQAIDWAYSYYQARFNYQNWFAQAYLNTSDAGDTFLFRTGAPIIDKSKVFVTQLQHSANLGSAFEFTYGGDLIRTMPETGGTINGSREEDDNYTEVGAYLQSRVMLAPKIDLVLAAREDWHSELSDPVFSPRAALVLKPTPSQNIRLTYNRAFSTPSSLNLFLDIDGGPAGELLGPFGFRVRAQGPGKDGIRLTDSNGMPLGMRTPFAGQPSALVPVDVATLYTMQLNALILATTGTPNALPAALQQLMRSFAADPNLQSIGISTLNPTTLGVAPLTAASVQDVPGIQPSISNTFEVGYKGVIGDRLLLAADVWRSEETDLTSPLVVRTPLLLLNPQALGGYLVPKLTAALMQIGLPAAQAQAQATAIATGMAQIPGGVASSEEVAALGTDLLATYVNFGEVSLWGVDLSGTALLTDEWTLSATASFVSDHNFCLIDVTGDCPEEQLVALNAPKQKGSATLGYRGQANGLSGDVRVRHTGEFPVNSADFVGLQCLGVAASAECVDSFTLVDLTLGYELPTWRGASVQLAVTNVFDTAYRSFVGVPEIGRLALLRLRYEF